MYPCIYTHTIMYVYINCCHISWWIPADSLYCAILFITFRIQLLMVLILFSNDKFGENWIPENAIDFHCALTFVGIQNISWC